MKKIIVKIEWDTTCCNTPIAVGGITTSLSHFCDKHNWVVTELPTEPIEPGEYCECPSPSTPHAYGIGICQNCNKSVKPQKKLYFCTNCEKRVIKAKRGTISTICDKCLNKPHKKIIEPETVFCDCENKFPQCHCCHKPIKERVK